MCYIINHIRIHMNIYTPSFFDPCITFLSNEQIFLVSSLFSLSHFNLFRMNPIENAIENDKAHDEMSDINHSISSFEGYDDDMDQDFDSDSDAPIQVRSDVTSNTADASGARIFENIQIDCPLCSDSSLKKNVHSIGLSFGRHVTSADDELESLWRSLEGIPFFNRADVYDFKNKLDSRSEFDGCTTSMIDLYNKLISVEYGKHSVWCVPGIVPTIAFLALTAIKFDCNIFVIKNDYVLKTLTVNTSVIKFPTWTGSLSRNVVIGIGGFGLFHSLIQPEGESETWARLDRVSFKCNDGLIESLSLHDDNVQSSPFWDNSSVQQSADPIEMIAGTEETLEDSSIQNVHIFAERLSLGEYLKKYSAIEDEVLKISSSTFSNEDKIDLGLTNIENSLSQSYDLDGFFLIDSWERIDAICRFSVEVILNPQILMKRDLASIKKHLKDSGMNQKGPLTAIKLAVIDSSFQELDFFCVACGNPDDELNFKSLNLTKISGIIAAESISKPCFDVERQLDLHPNCTNPGHRITLNGTRKNWIDAGGKVPIKSAVPNSNAGTPNHRIALRNHPKW